MKKTIEIVIKVLLSNMAFGFSLIALQSCNTAPGIEGFWIIDSITIDARSSMDVLLNNTIQFKKDNSCRLPVTRMSENANGKWQISNSAGTPILEISAENNPLSGKYRMTQINKYSPNDTIELQSPLIFFRMIKSGTLQF